MIDNPTITPYLSELLGDDFRLDHVYLDVIRSGKGPIGTRLHGGAVPFNPTHYFRFEGDQMHNGLSVVAYNLKDVGAYDGGFGCVPGSHKSNYSFPDEWKEMEEPGPVGGACDRACWDGHHIHRGVDARHTALGGFGRAADGFLQIQSASGIVVGGVF